MKRTILACMTAVILSLGAGIAAASDDRGYGHYEGGAYPGKFYGTVEKLPAEGWQGIWVINGREVLVTGRTKIEEEYGRAVTGAYVEVKGNYIDKTFTAYEIEVKGQGKYRNPVHSQGQNDKTATKPMPYQERVFNSKFSGTIESMPEIGYDGLWVIDGRKVEVTGSTLIDETKGRAAVGAAAEVKGSRTAETVTAHEIEIRKNK